MIAAHRTTVCADVACDNACVFCAQAGIERAPAPIAAVVEVLAEARARGSNEVTFVGGEPTLVEELPEMVAAARDAGFVRIGVQTNGARLSERAASLAAAGVTDVHVSIHGARPDVHDHHTSREGSFARLREGMSAARRELLTLTATTVLTRSNYRVLAEMEVSLSSAGVAAWCIEVPVARGRGEDSFDRVVPRLALALPFALHALARVSHRGIATFVRGAPRCLLGPFVARALPSEARSYASVCASCDDRSSCPGIDARYLARFSDGELRNKSQAPAPLWSEEELVLARTFVGPGEFAPARPASARAQLAQLRVVG